MTSPTSPTSAPPREPIERARQERENGARILGEARADYPDDPRWTYVAGQRLAPWSRTPDTNTAERIAGALDAALAAQPLKRDAPPPCLCGTPDQYCIYYGRCRAAIAVQPPEPEPPKPIVVTRMLDGTLSALPEPGDAERLDNIRIDMEASHRQRESWPYDHIRFLLQQLDAAQSALAAQPPEPVSEVLVGRLRPDRSTYYICPARPGFHFITAEGESTGALLQAFREFCGLHDTALAAQPPEPAEKRVRAWAKKAVDRYEEVIGSPPQPGDAERLARLRASYKGCAETDSNQPVGIGHPVFLLRLLDAAQSALAASQKDRDAESAPPQPGDAETIEPETMEWIRAHLAFPDAGLEHESATLLLKQLDAAQSALADTRQALKEMLDRVARVAGERDSYKYRTIGMEAEFARLRSPAATKGEAFDKLHADPSIVRPADTPDALFGCSPTATFGEPAPRNFDKEQPGPGWKISDEAQQKLEAMEQRHRESVANLRSPTATADAIQAICPGDNEPCYAGEGDNAHWRCGTVQCPHQATLRAQRSPTATGEDREAKEIVRKYINLGVKFVVGPNVYAQWMSDDIGKAIAAARSQGRASLFVDGEFTAHSGQTLPYKIECDALTDADIATLAADIARRFKFSMVVGVPRGGIRLRNALMPYIAYGCGTLIVDDVLTTGRSMEEHRRHFDPTAQGVVIFARGPCPDWITPLFGEGIAMTRPEIARAALSALPADGSPTATGEDRPLGYTMHDMDIAEALFTRGERTAIGYSDRADIAKAIAAARAQGAHRLAAVYDFANGCSATEENMRRIVELAAPEPQEPGNG